MDILDPSNPASPNNPNKIDATGLPHWFIVLWGLALLGVIVWFGWLVYKKEI